VGSFADLIVVICMCSDKFQKSILKNVKNEISTQNYGNCFLKGKIG
jgi:hypothetical protein